MGKRTVIIQVAGLGYDFLRRHHGTKWEGLEFQPLTPSFPALTCTAQAAFRTGDSPASHGMIANGIFNRELRRPLFWEQSSALVTGSRIWEGYQAKGKTVALLFWQQSLGENADIILSPAPIHKHGGGLVPSVYSQPAGLYEDLCRHAGGTFPLHRYWGPLASARSSKWIALATAALLNDKGRAPDLCLTYLPVLDYDLQRYGPDHPAAQRSLQSLFSQLSLIRTAATANGYDIVIWGDYAIGPTHTALFPNRLLHEAGLFRTRSISGRLYPDFNSSRAFAVADHEVAHVYIGTQRLGETPRPTLSSCPVSRTGRANRPGEPKVRAQGHQDDMLAELQACFSTVEGIARVLGPQEQTDAGIANPHGGELVLEAKPGYWFAYPWWRSRREAPDFATHVDIHNKPGYDPCELFFGWPPPSVSQDTSRIKGSHGHRGTGSEAAWASTLPFNKRPDSLQELAGALRAYLEQAP